MVSEELELARELEREGVLRTPLLIDAWKKIKRRDFLPDEFLESAAVNAPLPIGHGQTISQPYTVAFMLELLSVEKGMKVLDVGSGSGWQTALLSHMVGETGHVYALERIPELTTFGEKNVSKYSFVKSGRTLFFTKDGWGGLPEHAPFDRIIVAAAADAVPPMLLEQLKNGGRLVVPVGSTVSQDIVLVVKDSKGNVREKHFSGFIFVPFVKGGKE